MKSSLLSNSLYREDLERISALYDLSLLAGKTLMISGATGMIGSFLVDLLMASERCINIIALGRNKEKAENRFQRYFESPYFKFVECDVAQPIPEDAGDVDFIVHAASTTHPVAYATEPIGTITSNVFGTRNLLDYGICHGLQRFILLSSVEVYGENRGDVNRFSESYCGYIDSNTLRAGYPESKRLCESLCQAYRKQKCVEAVIVRIARSFGPTMQMSDTKALSQFIKRGLTGENIVLKSEGNQLFSYTYVADAVSGILACLLCGHDGAAYNVAYEEGDVTLRYLASAIASICKSEVEFEIPNDTERSGYSTATKALMDSTKIKKELGWIPQYSIDDALRRTISMLRYLG